MRRSLWTLAEATDARLTQAGDEGYFRKESTLPEIRARLIELYEADPKVMPLMRIRDRFNDGLSAHVERGQVVDGQPSKGLRKTLESNFGDWIHLGGAAYCDVFTCDGIVAGWLDDVRETQGFERQRTVRGYPGGPQGFVTDLMATLP